MFCKSCSGRIKDSTVPTFLLIFKNIVKEHPTRKRTLLRQHVYNVHARKLHAHRIRPWHFLCRRAHLYCRKRLNNRRPKLNAAPWVSSVWRTIFISPAKCGFPFGINYSYSILKMVARSPPGFSYINNSKLDFLLIQYSNFCTKYCNLCTRWLPKTAPTPTFQVVAVVVEWR